MNSRLEVALHPNWEQVRDPSGAALFMRRSRRNSNASQVSWSSWDTTASTAVDLPDLMTRWIERLGGTEIQLAPSDQPHRLISAEFRAESFAYCRAWHIKHGPSLISATFICDGLPTETELQEVNGIAETLKIVQVPRKKWVFF